MRVLLITSLSCASALLPGVASAPVIHEQSGVQAPRGHVSDRFTEIGLNGREVDDNLIVKQHLRHLTPRLTYGESEPAGERASGSSGCIIA
ncbi:hypothetical protein B0H16DRAFT_1551068 [Mycena metata]|uniref:Uncharacterized protein n=1 Tax=Mycena metata TaxID=1033252 RepID=A0AAD7ISN3_9AGAR|nr:hypothetical protein B0H16DRAFT_1551068 [Mycena metata]